METINKTNYYTFYDLMNGILQLDYDDKKYHIDYDEYLWKDSAEYVMWATDKEGNELECWKFNNPDDALEAAVEFVKQYK